MSFPLTIETALIYAGAFGLAVSLILTGVVISLHVRLKRLTLGKSGSIEEGIKDIALRTKNLESFRAELEKYLAHAEERLRRSVQGIGIVRFNPFGGEGLGGNQSFAAAFLNEEGDGVVMSTLYSRDRVSVYGKPLARFLSTYELTEEEKQAVTQARASLARNE